MKRVRRSKEETAAGFPLELKQKGVLFEDWIKDNKAPSTEKEQPNGKRIKRTKEETAAGFPLELKKQGVSFTEWQQEQLKKEDKVEQLPQKLTAAEKQAGMSLEDKQKGMTLEAWQATRAVNKVKPSVDKDKGNWVKSSFPPEAEIKKASKEDDWTGAKTTIIEKVIVADKNTRKDIKEIIVAQIGKLTYEWKHVDLDSKFKATDLTKYGKQGWKMMFMLEQPAGSKKPTQLCFQRLISKGK